MAKQHCLCFKLPAFVFTYPFTVFLVARLYALICVICILFIIYLARNRVDRVAALVAIFDLIVLFIILVSLWLTVQKFFYVKLDAAMSFCSLIFIIGGLISACSVSQKSDTNHLFYIIICHLYLFCSQFFSICWSMFSTHNSVSRLFIRDWGKSVTKNEVELLERDF